MSKSARSAFCWFVLLAAFLCPVWAFGQSETASLSGHVVDPQEAVVVNAKVEATNTDTNTTLTTHTNRDGVYVFPSLRPGRYRLTVSSQGFKTVTKVDLILHVQDQIAQNFSLPIGPANESVTVTAGGELINTQSAVVETVVDRQFMANIPLNGRSFQSLITLTPGVVLSKPSSGSGQFSINGQRNNANYFTIDGVSANINVNPAFTGQSGANPANGGTVPGFNAFGGTNNLLSVDAMQEFKIQTSSYSAEFGRQPGGQIQIASRSGTNEFHGTLFDYFRNDALDANDWFADASKLPKAALRQNDFGGVFGGPILKNRTFFFFSYEGLRLRLPKVAASVQLPAPSLRQQAPTGLQPFLNALPIPTGPENPATRLAPFSASYSDPVTMNATSIRIDHAISSKSTIFGRYNYAPSESSVRNLSSVFSTQINTQTLTLGTSMDLTPRASNELRFNYSRNVGRGSRKLDTFGGAVTPPDNVLFPAPFASPQTSRMFFTPTTLGSTQISVGKDADNLQRQINIAENFSLVAGKHSLKFGVDYRRLSPFYGPFDYSLSASFFTVSAILAGKVSSGGVSTGLGVGAIFNNFSAYAQDNWKIGRRLTIDYGLRWDLNPPPHGANGRELFTVTGVDNLAALAPAPPGTPLYPTRYNGFAPRIGLAYLLRQEAGWETVVRGGFGVFYDLGSGQAGNVASFFPFNLVKMLSNGSPFPDPNTVAPPPAPNFNPPIRGAGGIVAFEPQFSLPRTYEWNVALQHSLGANQTFTASYVGAAGRRLLRVEQIANPGANFPSADTIFLTRSAANSDYHALQLQFQRRLSRGLQALASYTWSHSIDSASDDTFSANTSIRTDRVDPRNRGASDFDVRHVFSTAVTYDIPAPRLVKPVRAILGNWSLDTVVRAQSATPVNVTLIRDLGFGIVTVFRPDLVPRVPLYLQDRTVAGGKRINPAAFSVSPDPRQGTLGRNALRGFPLSQVDFAVRRQFNLTERFRLQFRAEFFNALNHPNFADPINLFGFLLGGQFVPGSSFGISTQMLNKSLSSQTFGASGLSPLYQIGGPRSTQFTLRLLF